MKETNDRTIQTKAFFIYLVSEIGETRDAKRFEIPDNDLIKMSKLFKSFMVNRDDFESDDLRCKIHNIDRLQNQHWLIDRDWTEDKKKELNIHDDTTEIDEPEFFLIFYLI